MLDAAEQPGRQTSAEMVALPAELPGPLRVVGGDADVLAVARSMRSSKVLIAEWG